MEKAIKVSRFDDYFGQSAFEQWGNKVFKALKGQTVSKAIAKADAPGGLRFEAVLLGIDMFDLLECLEGLCYNNLAQEIDDSTYLVGIV